MQKNVTPQKPKDSPKARTARRPGQVAALRSLIAQLQRDHADERHRAARALHDEVAQCLVAANFTLGALNSSEPSAPAGTARTAELVGRAIRAAGRICEELSLSVIEHGDFEHALLWAARDVEQHGGPRCRLCVKGAHAGLGQEFKETLIYILRDALHGLAPLGAKAAPLEIDVVQGDSAVILRIRAQGISDRSAAHSALLAARERLRRAGGSSTLRGIGEGVLFRASLPTPGAER